jgi:esterase/lipase superfamily enzyme
MERRNTSWFSPNLQMEMPLVAYGYSGQNTANAADRRGPTISSTNDFIWWTRSSRSSKPARSERIQSHSVNKWSLLNKEMPPKLKAELLTRYDRYITEELLPLIRNENDESVFTSNDDRRKSGALSRRRYEYFKHRIFSAGQFR